jgi:16S rRNA (guanine527-N7)-methyltransferase
VPHPEPLTPEGFAGETGVSRETLDRLVTYLEVLVRWNRTHDLVAQSTLLDPWRRHMLDSWQLGPMAPEAKSWCDLGAGAGFPGLVIAAVLGDAGHVRLVDSNNKRCAFLREASRAMGLATEVIHGRIEDAEAVRVDCVTARALAPLPRLLVWLRPYLERGATALLLKGEDAEAECAATPALSDWTWTLSPSLSDPRGRILQISGRDA